LCPPLADVLLANILANMPMRNSGHDGTVWACVEASAAPQARSGATRNDGVRGSIPRVGSKTSLLLSQQGSHVPGPSAANGG
jgi:hypothetical protein